MLHTLMEFRSLMTDEDVHYGKLKRPVGGSDP